MQIFAMLIAAQERVNYHDRCRKQEAISYRRDDLKIVAGPLVGLAEHRADKGKNFDSVGDPKAYLEKLRGAWRTSYALLPNLRRTLVGLCPKSKAKLNR
jgi:hypothetical protein